MVVDTVPHASAGALAAAKLADLVLVPCRPSTPDLAAIGASLEVAHLANAPLAVVFNGVPARGSPAAVQGPRPGWGSDCSESTAPTRCAN